MKKNCNTHPNCGVASAFTKLNNCLMWPLKVCEMNIFSCLFTNWSCWVLESFGVKMHVAIIYSQGPSDLPIMWWVNTVWLQPGICTVFWSRSCDMEHLWTTTEEETCQACWEAVQPLHTNGLKDKQHIEVILFWSLFLKHVHRNFIGFINVDHNTLRLSEQRRAGIIQDVPVCSSCDSLHVTWRAYRMSHLDSRGDVAFTHIILK